jgi:hypothetical protein
VREDLAADRAADGRRQASAERVELGADTGADLAHARLEAAHVEDLEVACDER